jgi:hypothetical protein
MLPAAAALWAGMAALSLLACGWRALDREAAALERGLGADEAAAVGEGWKTWQIERVAASAAGEAGVGGVTAMAVLPLPDGREGALAGMAGDFASAVDWKWSPRAPDRLDLRGASRVLWVPRETAERTGWTPGRSLDLDGAAWRIEGTYDAGGRVPPGLPPDALLVPAGALEQGNDDVWLVLVRAAPGNDLKRTLARVDAELWRVAGGSAPEWITPERLAEGLRRWQRALASALGWGAGLYLLLAATGMASTQLAGVRERVPEIGLRRALGARKGDIAALFVAEAVLLAALAGVAAAASAWWASAWLGGRLPLELHLAWGDLAWPALTGLAVSVASSLPPARAAARLDPAEALRGE